MTQPYSRDSPMTFRLLNTEVHITDLRFLCVSVSRWAQMIFVTEKKVLWCMQYYSILKGKSGDILYSVSLSTNPMKRAKPTINCTYKQVLSVQSKPDVLYLYFRAPLLPKHYKTHVTCSLYNYKCGRCSLFGVNPTYTILLL